MMELAAQTEDDRLSDASMRERLAALSLRRLDADGAWVAQSEDARLGYLTAQVLLPDSPTLVVAHVSSVLCVRVRTCVWREANGALAPLWRFLHTGRALDA